MSWCNDYCHRKWTWQHKFTTWTRLFALYTVLMPLEKLWIQLFFLQLWANSKADWVLQPWLGNQCRRKKTEFKPVNLCLKTDLVSHPACVEGLGKYIQCVEAKYGMIFKTSFLVWFVQFLKKKTNYKSKFSWLPLLFKQFF